jgi:hypothetical protein
MRDRTVHRTWKAAVAILTWQVLAFPGTDRTHAGRAAQGFEVAVRSGYITDRLTGGQLRLWQSIAGIVLAEDPSGWALHPKLRRLWRETESSGCRLFVEMADTHPRVASRAGEFRIEAMDPDGRIQSGVIRLYLGTIDRARLRASSNAEEGFDLFRNLGKEERYAVVLGHELAHACAALRDPAYAGSILEIWRETESYYRMTGGRPASAPHEQDRVACLKRIAALSNELEQAAEVIDPLLWRELVQNRLHGLRPPVLQVATR